MSTLTEKMAKRFGCSTCRKTWANKTTANRHIADGCIHDPEVRACASCKHDNRGHPGGYEEMAEAPHCEIGVRSDGDMYVRHCPAWVGEFGGIVLSDRRGK